MLTSVQAEQQQHRQQYEATLENLKEELTSARNISDKVGCKSAALYHQQQKQKIEALATIGAEIDAHEKTKWRLKDEITRTQQLKRRLAIATAQLSKPDLKVSHTNTPSARNPYRTYGSRMESELVEARERADRAITENTALRNKLTEAEDWERQQKHQMDALKRKLEEVPYKTNMLQPRVRWTTDQITELKATLEREQAVQSTLQSVQGELNNVKLKNESLLMQVNRVNQETSETLQTKANDFCRQLQNVKEEVFKASKRESALQAQLQDMEKKVSQGSKREVKLQTQLKKARQVITGSLKRNNKLGTQLHKMKQDASKAPQPVDKNLRQAAEEYPTARTDIIKAQEEYNAMLASSNKARKQAAEKQARIEELQTGLEGESKLLTGAREEVDELRRELQTATSQAANVTRKADEAHSELQVAMDQIAEANKRLGNAETERNTLRSELADTRAQITDLQRELKQQRTEAEQKKTVAAQGPEEPGLQAQAASQPNGSALSTLSSNPAAPAEPGSGSSIQGQAEALPQAASPASQDATKCSECIELGAQLLRAFNLADELDRECKEKSRVLSRKEEQLKKTRKDGSELLIKGERYKAQLDMCRIELANEKAKVCSKCEAN